MRNDYINWTTEQLLEYEQRLYDAGIEGDNNWFERDKILWELVNRDISVRGEILVFPK